MRFLSAPFVFPVSNDPISNGIIVVEDSGKIMDVIDPAKQEISSSIIVETYNGILCPGFINAHCHLELAHLKGKIEKKKKLPEFISDLIEVRSAHPDIVTTAMKDADEEMFNNGIVAVGDISNTSASIQVKKSSRIMYHTFIEVYDIFPERAGNVLTNGRILQKEFNENGQKTSIVPHSPYTVSERLFKMLTRESMTPETILSIHNQETVSENEMFVNGKGELINKLHGLTGAYDKWKSFNKSSLRSYLEYLPAGISLQLVHNNFTTSDDIHYALKYNPSLYWCMCVNANLYIEDKMPDIKMFYDEGCNLTIGTDSYASNDSLSVLDELKTINSNFPEIPLYEIIKWSTLNAAKFLNIGNLYGSLEKGKFPGIILLTDISEGKNQLSSETVVQRVV
jgi:cytosine/adenosine deaminase-related metal-dependent hydrolase